MIRVQTHMFFLNLLLLRILTPNIILKFMRHLLQMHLQSQLVLSVHFHHSLVQIRLSLVNPHSLAHMLHQ